MTACVECGADHPWDGSSRCRPCYDRRRRRGPRGTCVRCAKQRPIIEPSGRCDWCVFATRPRPPRVVPPCAACGEQRRLVAHGRCNRCLLKMPEQIWVYAAGLAGRLGDTCPAWFDAIAAHVADRYSPSEARLRLRELGRLLTPSVTAEPDRLVAAARRPDGRLSPLGLALEEFFSARGVVRAVGDTEARAAAQRARVIAKVPDPLRPAVAAFSQAELANRDRARRVGARPLADQTLLIHLQVVGDFAALLAGATPPITAWETVAQTDVEAFLARRSPAGSHLLPSLRAFFGWARTSRLVLIDPTRGLRNPTGRRFSGPVITLADQRLLFRRWATPDDVHPYEALVGLLTLLHGTSVAELRHLRIADVDTAARTLVLDGRAHPVPLDPITWATLERALVYRQTLGTTNPHVLVNRRTKVSEQPVAPAYPNDLLAPFGVSPQRLRCTRLAQLCTTGDPILFAELFGVTHSAVLYYLADWVDEEHLANL